MITKIRKYLSKKNILPILIEVIGVILIWWGIWGLLDRYLFPNNKIIAYILCILIGFAFVWFDDKELKELK